MNWFSVKASTRGMGGAGKGIGGLSVVEGLPGVVEQPPTRADVDIPVSQIFEILLLMPLTLLTSTFTTAFIVGHVVDLL